MSPCCCTCIAARGHTKGHLIARRARLSVSGHRPVAVRSVVSIVRDTSMTLPDGRVLAYADLGARSGRLVIHSDGAPSSRLELVLFDEIFSELDVRWCARTVPAMGVRLPGPVVEWRTGRRTSRRWRTVCAASDSPSPVPRVVGPMRWLVPRCSQTGSQQWVSCVAPPTSAGPVPGRTTRYEADLMCVADEVEAVAWCGAVPFRTPVSGPVLRAGARLLRRPAAACLLHVAPSIRRITRPERGPSTLGGLATPTRI